MVASDAAARVVVCDAGPLIHLDELERINLLDDFADVLVPTAVWNEVIRHRPSALTVTGVPLRRVSAGSTLAADLDVLARTFPLHEGEREALQVAQELHVDLLLTDDTAARLAAQTLGISVHGTIGILFRAVRRRRMTGTELAALLRSLPDLSTLHLKRDLLLEFIQRAEQSE
jgi:predicted nucleic acid-binding protein